MSEPERADHEYSIHGLWWVSEAPKSKVSGVLRFGSSRGITIELSKDPVPALRAKGKLDEQTRRWRHKPNVLLGLADQSQEPITVIDALPLRIGPQLRFFANHVFRGAHFVDPHSATFKHASFELDHLEAWAGGPLICEARPPESPDSSTLFEFDSEIGHWEIHADVSPFYREREFGKICTCTFLLTAKDTFVLTNLFAEFEKLISLMTILAGVRLRPRHLLVVQRHQARPIELIASWQRSVARSLIHWDMLVPLSNLGETAPLVFGKWFDQWSSLQECIGMFLTGLSTKFTDVKFLSLINAVEAFHRATQAGELLPSEEFEQWRVKLMGDLPSDMPKQLRDKVASIYQYANEPSLRTRVRVLLQDVLKRSKSPYTQRDCKSFVNKIVNARNRLAHGTHQPTGNLGQESVDLTYILLELLLMQIGCTDQAVATALRRLPFCSLVAEVN